MTGRDPMFEGGSLPVLPFAGRSGSMGSELSHQRADREDENGTTTDRQNRVIEEIRMSGIIGRTWKEIADTFRWHHGQATGALSPLHATGHIAALATEYGRDGCSVYVTPDNVGGRETRAYGGKTMTKTFRELAVAQAQELEAAQAYIEQLERDIAEANGLADQARTDLGQARTEYLGDAARKASRISALETDLTAQKAANDGLRRVNEAMRMQRALLSLEPDERTLVETIGERLATTTLTDEQTIKIYLKTLRALHDIARRLYVTKD